MALTRRAFLAGVAAAAAGLALPRHERFRPKPLPPPPSPEVEFVRVVVPMCFYSHARRITLVQNLRETVVGPYSAAEVAMAIQFERC